MSRGRGHPGGAAGARRLAAAVALLASVALLGACDAPPDGGEPEAAPAISGATLDAIQAEIAQRVALDAEGARVERGDGGRHLVVHATVSEAMDERALGAACDDLRDLFARHLVPGQSVEVFFLQGGEVTHSCPIE